MALTPWQTFLQKASNYFMLVNNRKPLTEAGSEETEALTDMQDTYALLDDASKSRYHDLGGPCFVMKYVSANGGSSLI